MTEQLASSESARKAGEDRLKALGDEVAALTTAKDDAERSLKAANDQLAQLKAAKEESDAAAAKAVEDLERERKAREAAEQALHSPATAHALMRQQDGPQSPLRVLGEDVVFPLHDRVAGEPALGVVALRRLVRLGGGRERVGRGVVLERAYPHPPLSANRALSFTMKSTSCRAPATFVGPGASSLVFGFQWIFAILAPSGKGLPLPGMPAW